MKTLVVLACLVTTALAQSPDRRVAEWTLSMGGRVGIKGIPQRIADLNQLPEGDFELEVLDWLSLNADPPDLERLGGLRHLKELHLAGPFWNRNADGGRDGSKDLQYLKSITTLEVLTFGYHFLDSIRFHDAGLTAIASLTNLRELVLRQAGVKGHPLESFHKLEALDVTLCPFDDQGLANVAGMPGMRRLWIGDTLITDAGMSALSKLEKLEDLDLHGTAITDAGFAQLRGLKSLKKLNLMGVNVTDASMDIVAGFKELEELNLYRTKVSNAGVSRLKGLSHLAEIDLRYSRVGRGGIDELRAALPSARLRFVEQTVRAKASPAASKTVQDTVTLAGTGVTDADLAKLSTSIRNLNLEATEIGDAGLANLSRLTALEELVLDSTSVSDTGLAYLKTLSNLRRLRLANTYVEGDGLTHLLSLARLVDLNLTGSPVGNSTIEILARFPALRRLSLQSTDIADGVKLDELQQITELDLAATDLTDAGIPPLAKLQNLRILILRDARFTDKGLPNLSSLTSLESLDLIRTRISDKGMPDLAAMHGLKTLLLDYGEIYDAGLEKLAPLTGLESLSLDSTHITDKSVETLKGFRHLKRLNLYHTFITAEGVSALRKALPDCHIIWDPDSSRPNRRRS